MNLTAVRAIYVFEMARWGRTLLQSIVAPVISTSLYFIVFGAAIGSRVPDIDGVSYGKGEVVRIERGVHRLQAKGGRSARLIWGERLQEPPFPLPAPPYWTDF